MPLCLCVSSFQCRAAAVLVLVLLALGAPALAEDKASGSQEKRTAIAKPAEAPGILLAREAGKPWQLVGSTDSIFTRDTLLVLPGGRATFVTDNKALTVELWGNLPQVSDFPVLESAISLRESSDVDLDLTLDRGRVLVAKSSKKEDVKIRVRVRDQVWNLTLNDPDTTVAFELAARMMPGSEFHRPPYDDNNRPARPRVEATCYAIKGSVEFHQQTRMVRLKAPPGAARVEWNNIESSPVIPLGMARIPTWVEDKAPYDGSEYLRAALDRVAKQMKDKTSVESALNSLLDDAGKEPDQRRAALLRNLAIFGFGAVDDGARLADLLDSGKTPEIRDNAIEALRHWIGRAPGKDVELYNYLTTARKYEPGQAETVIKLLIGFTRDELEDPRTYTLLIKYVNHSRLAVRELARWHLMILTHSLPGTTKIKYDPAGPADVQERAAREWRKLIPEGKVPEEKS